MTENYNKDGNTPAIEAVNRSTYTLKRPLRAGSNGWTSVPPAPIDDGKKRRVPFFRPFKEWTGVEKVFAGVASSIILTSAGYHGFMYAAGSGWLGDAGMSLAVQTHLHIMQATNYAQTALQAFQEYNGGNLDLIDLAHAGSDIGTGTQASMNRAAVNPIMEEFSKLFAGLDVTR